MESTHWVTGPGNTLRWRGLVVAVVAMLVISFGMSPAVSAQDGTETPETPDVVIPGTGEDDESNAATPEAEPADEATEEPTEEAESDEESSTSGTSRR